jgi:hypothetical protein
MQCQCDEIGRHDGFKIRCFNERGGSSPPTGTILLFDFKEKKSTDLLSVFLCLEIVYCILYLGYNGRI